MTSTRIRTGAVLLVLSRSTRHSRRRRWLRSAGGDRFRAAPSLPDNYGVADLVLGITVALDTLALEPRSDHCAGRRRTAASHCSPWLGAALIPQRPRSWSVAVAALSVASSLRPGWGLYPGNDKPGPRHGGKHADRADAPRCVGVPVASNRELLSGRGVPLSMLREMREVVVAQAGRRRSAGPVRRRRRARRV